MQTGCNPLNVIKERIKNQPINGKEFHLILSSIYRDSPKHQISFIFSQILYYIKDFPLFDIHGIIEISNIMLIFHSALLYQSYDEYYETIENLVDVYPINHNFMWILSSPVIKKTKQIITKKNNKRFIHLVAFQFLSTHLCVELDLELIDILIKDMHTEKNTHLSSHEYFILTDILTSIGYYISGPVRIKYTPEVMNKYIKYRKSVQMFLKPWNIPPKIDQTSIAFIMDNPAKHSSDFKCCVNYITILKSKGYRVVVYHPYTTTKEAINNPIWDDIIGIPDCEDKTIASLKKYKYAFYVTHIHSLNLHLLSNRLGQTQIGLLGQIITSGVPELDYFLVPEWDNPANYTETIVPMPGMGCYIPLIEKNTNTSNPMKSEKIHIAFTLTGVKLNRQIGPLCQAINEKVNNVHFHMLMGEQREAILKLPCKNSIHFQPFLENYSVSYNNIQEYYTVITYCDLILCPFPYSPFMTIIDIFKYKKPMVILCDKTRNSTQCAARLLMLMGLDSLIVYTVEEYIDLAVKIAQNKEYQNQIIEKLSTIDFNHIISMHNDNLDNAFDQWFNQIDQ